MVDAFHREHPPHKVESSIHVYIPGCTGNLAYSAYYKGAVKALRDNRRACSLLGEPLRFQTLKLGDPENVVTTERAHVRKGEGLTW